MHFRYRLSFLQKEIEKLISANKAQNWQGRRKLTAEQNMNDKHKCTLQALK